jgi:hypothetical protein
MILNGGGCAGEVVDFVELEKDRVVDVVADELEIRFVEQVGDVVFLAGEEVVEADDVMALGDEAIAEVRAEEAGAAGDEDAFERRC